MLIGNSLICCFLDSGFQSAIFKYLLINPFLCYFQDSALSMEIEEIFGKTSKVIEHSNSRNKTGKCEEDVVLGKILNFYYSSEVN